MTNTPHTTSSHSTHTTSNHSTTPHTVVTGKHIYSPLTGLRTSAANVAKVQELIRAGAATPALR